MKTFDELWQDILERCDRFSFPLVQDKEELRFIFNLIQGCASYFEVGTAEGNSLYILAHALKEDSYIKVLDYGEPHTAAARDEAMKRIPHTRIKELYGNSHDAKVIFMGQESIPVDVVFIDAGHSYEDVVADAIAYGHLATKFIIFHDIQLPPVKAAFEWYCAQNSQMKASTFINSPTFGYGILEV